MRSRSWSICPTSIPGLGLAIFASWAISTWLGLRIVEAVYNGGFAGGLFDDILADSANRPLRYYRIVLWQLTSLAHALGAIVMLVASTWRLHSASLLLVILLAGDLIFVSCSFTFGGKCTVASDGSIPEIYGYLKQLTAAGVCLWLWRIRLWSTTSGAFAILFLWLFIDDAFQYHERMGSFLDTYFKLSRFSPREGLRGQDIGEALSAVLPIACFLPLLLCGYNRSDSFSRRASHVFLALIALLGVFGLIVDMLGRLASSGLMAKIAVHIEESGEMIVTSLIVTYAASLAWRTAEDITERAD